jgi:predicted transcriptional regulator YheO
MELLAAGLGSDITINVLASVIASIILLGAGFLFGKYKERRHFGKRLEEYDFYPYTVNRDNFPEFSLNNFRLGMHYFLRNFDARAARHLIFIGEQNDVRAKLEPAEQKVYARLFSKYDGSKIADDSREYLENFHRIVRLIGKSFPNIGIEVLLHDLSNPSRSLVALENNVTGRRLHDGTTNLVIDLKKRQAANEDKLNYEIDLGARRFKCTTIPIIRPEYGVVGAICINVDANYLTEEVLSASDKMASFIQTFCRTDMKVEENILSRDEYAKALKGKRHFKDDRFE